MWNALRPKLFFFAIGSVGICCLVLVAYPLFGQSAEQRLLNKVEQQHQQWVSLVADFIQQEYDADFQLVNTARGQVAFLKPGLMRWQYSPPEEQTIVVGKNKVWVYDPVLENVSIQNSEEIEGISFLRALTNNGDLSQQFKLLSRHSPEYEKLSQMGRRLMQPNTSQVILHLKPKKLTDRIQSLHLTVDKTTYILQAFGLIDAAGEQRNIHFLNILQHQQQGQMNEQDFVFLIPDGVDVIEE